MVQKMAEGLMDGPDVVQTTAEEAIKEVVEPIEEVEMPVYLGVI